LHRLTLAKDLDGLLQVLVAATTSSIDFFIEPVDSFKNKGSQDKPLENSDFTSFKSIFLYCFEESCWPSVKVEPKPRFLGF
jgi:hypothetical protein